VVEAPRPTPDPAPRPRSGEVSVGGHTINGEWEDGELLGEPLLLEAGVDFADIVYAARGRDATYVATGVRDGDRILRTIVATTPSGTDGIQLYGGDVLGERGPDERVARGRGLGPGTARAAGRHYRRRSPGERPLRQLDRLSDRATDAPK
jgi:hypothetical protein